MVDTPHFYAWVRVGDGDPEPAAIEGEKPNRTATTIGCPDKFNVDSSDSGCSIVLAAHPSNYGNNQYWSDYYGQAEECDIEFELHSLVEVSREEAAEREKAYQRALKTKPHSYAGFGRRA